MELSEHESRILQEIELDLTASAPRLARALTSATSRGSAARHFMLGTAVMGLGIGTMIFALALGSMPAGALAFLTMTMGAQVASARVRLSRTRHKGHRTAADSQNSPDQ